MSENELLATYYKITCYGHREMTEERFLQAIGEVEGLLNAKRCEFKRINNKLKTKTNVNK